MSFRRMFWARCRSCSLRPKTWGPKTPFRSSPGHEDAVVRFEVAGRSTGQKRSETSNLDRPQNLVCVCGDGGVWAEKATLTSCVVIVHGTDSSSAAKRHRRLAIFSAVAWPGVAAAIASRMQARRVIPR
jgi:hypothetical protein